MKRRVLYKTMSFHVKKKKQNGVVLSDTVLLSPSPGHAAGEGGLFSSSFFINSCEPRALQKTRNPKHLDGEKSGAPRLASHAHWPANPVLWQGSKALLPMRCYRVAIGMPPLPFAL
jgi:hypothetical protein